ncbi:MAG: SDR family NAD(P)-dependent oxidoreductase, partial [bacterium]|nr:SDR family NAD(P)-dependent oxidoreductase [bacterium]
MNNEILECVTVKQLLECFDLGEGKLEAFQMKDGNSYSSITYGELQDRVRAVANTLLNMGIKKGDKIGLLSGNRIEWPIVYLAVTSMGAIIVPIDIFWEKWELGTFIEFSDVSLIFVSNQHLEKIIKLKAGVEKTLRVVCLDENKDICNESDEAAELKKEKCFDGSEFIPFPSLESIGKQLIQKGSSPYEAVKVNPEDIAAILYISPRIGVMISHKALLSNARGFLETLALPGGTGETWMTAIPFSHAYPANTGILLPLMGRRIGVSLSTSRLEAILQAVKEVKPHYMTFVPVLLEKLYGYLKGLQEKDELSLEALGFGNLRCIVVGGAFCPVELIEAMAKLGVRVFNAYGITEMSPVLATNTFKQEKSASVGIPLVNVEITIDNPDPSGNGEILARGPTVMTGYYKEEQNTANTAANTGGGCVFVDQKGWLHTGDIGRFDKEGFLYITGRSRNILIIKGGLNIYPEELETFLLQCKTISNVAILRKIDSGKKSSRNTSLSSELPGGFPEEYPYAVIRPDFDYIAGLEKETGKKCSTEEVKNLIRDEMDKISDDIAAYKMPRDFEITNENIRKSSNEKKWFMFEELMSGTVCVDKAPIKTNTPTVALTGKIENYMTEMVSKMLSIDELDIEKETNFLDLFDSVELVKMLRMIARQIRIQLAPPILFEYKNITELAAYFSTEFPRQFLEYLAPGEESEASHREGEPDVKEVYDKKKKPIERNIRNKTGNTHESHKNEPIAIVGAGCIFPGAKDIDAFWDNLQQDRCSITEIPAERFDWEQYYDDSAAVADIGASETGKIITKSGGFIGDIDKFEPSFFKLSPREAQLMDPQQRKLLEVVWKTIEDAGIKPSSLSGTKTGVFVAVVANEYDELLQQKGNVPEAHTFTGTMYFMVPNRISYILNLQGPSEAIDTACSGSLTAVNRAVQAIRNGDCEMAIAGGVNALLLSKLFVSFSNAGMLSPDGRCKTFDKEANGYVRGEGVGTVFLKPLAKALEDGDPVYAVIKGTAVNHGGHANSLTAPNPVAQAELIISALEDAGVDPASVSYIETHGTGTPLGDPIEISGLKKAFTQLYKSYNKPLPQEPHCGLGSVKTNIGHLEAAAGIAGLIKVILGMKYKKCPGLVGFHQLNPHIDLEGSPFYIVKEIQDWACLKKENGDDIPRLAGISSFGAGGSNAHVVVEEFIAAKSEPAKSEPAKSEIFPSTIAGHDSQHVIVPLSAKNEERLEAMARNLHGFIKKLQAATGDSGQESHDSHTSKRAGTDEHLRHLAYTLREGREAMDQRVVFLVKDITELMEKLDRFAMGKDKKDDCFKGNVKKGGKAIKLIHSDEDGREIVEKWIAKRKVKKLAQLWCEGFDINWELLYDRGNPKPRRINLPTYPFAGDRYWVPEGKKQSGSVSKAVPAKTSNEGEKVGTFLLRPVWDSFMPEKSPAFPHPTARIVIAGGTKTQRDQIRAFYSGAQILEIPFPEPPVNPDSIEALTQKMQVFGTVHHVVWIAPYRPLEKLGDDRLIEEQSTVVIQFFRTLKALLSLGLGTGDLGWTVITTQAQPIHKSDTLKVNPTHAGLHGLIGSMAGEYPGWKIRLIDLEASSDWPLEDIFSLAPDPGGNAFVYRHRQWHRRQLVPCRFPRKDPGAYRTGGVYVIIGGSGSVGEVWSEYMIRTYQARLIWIGRRAKDEAIRAKLERLAALGPEPLYIVADAADGKSLQAAYESIKEQFPQINGVVQSAAAMLGRNLADMDEKGIRARLAAKIDVSVRIAHVFHEEPLDFILFFSSVNSFETNPGKSSYSAGCAFLDAFALRMTHQWNCKVKVINWGYWGSLGFIAASPVFREWMEKTGIGSIEPPEAMAALETLLDQPVAQMALMKTTKPSGMKHMTFNPGESIVGYREKLPTIIQPPWDGLPKKEASLQQLRAKDDLLLKELDQLLVRILWGQLQTMGLFRDKCSTVSVLMQKGGIREVYTRWFEATMVILEEHKYLRYDSGTCTVTDTAPIDTGAVWAQWDQVKEPLLKDPDKKSHIRILDASLKALPEVLNGKRLATNVLFPNSSMELMEGFYKNNAVADYYNEMLADTVVAYIEERLKKDPTVQLRLLEIGAGTGGTSAIVFQKLQVYRENISEYCYTDLSKAFLMYAQKEYAPENPYLNCKIYNIELPCAQQGIEAGAYDIVIAANVLHATKDIHYTLRNTKSILRSGGIILLNEISANNLFTHLAFSLLEGWWLYRDPALRIPGCPGIYPEIWQEVLQNEGFHPVIFPAQEAHDLGQQIIVAQSDGVVRRKEQFREEGAGTPAETNREVGGTDSTYQQYKETQFADKRSSEEKTSIIQRDGQPTSRMVVDFVKEAITEKLSETLMVSADSIDDDLPFADYGVDSITGVRLVLLLNQDLGIKLETTSIFDHSTVNDLSAHILANFEETVALKVEQEENQNNGDEPSIAPSTPLIQSSPPKAASHGIEEKKTGEPSAFREPTPMTRILTKPETELKKGKSPGEPLQREPIAIIGMSGRYAQSE